MAMDLFEELEKMTLNVVDEPFDVNTLSEETILQW
jgi:hypothetical protein